MYFQYDINGVPLGFVYNEVQYFYLTNTMGDVLGITEANGNLIVQYLYDDWGKLVSIDTADAEGSTAYREIAEANPLRYRGYYYDNETGYYYLQSRYYDPEICRFINADVYCDTGTSTYNSYNMFAYCENNPVNCLDYTGEKLIIRKDANKFFKEIKKITSDTLSMNKSGNISIKTRVKRPKKIYGTDLLRTIIDSGYTVNIYTTSKGSYYSPANRNAFHPQKKISIFGEKAVVVIYILIRNRLKRKIHCLL